jgi:hypothetical protein
MDSELLEIEAALKAMRPKSADSSLDRLAAAMEGRMETVDPGMRAQEAELKAFRPAGFTATYRDLLLAQVQHIPFPQDEKLVIFPGKSSSPSKARPAARKSWFPMSAAAAVALAGGLTALLVDRNPSQSGGPVANGTGSSAIISNPSSLHSGVVPASFNSAVQEAKPEGLIWNKDGTPARIFRVVYRDHAKVTDANGKVVEVEQPRVEYLMVPEKVD